METKAKTGPPNQVRGHYQALSIPELHVAAAILQTAVLEVT